MRQKNCINKVAYGCTLLLAFSVYLFTTVVQAAGGQGANGTHILTIVTAYIQLPSKHKVGMYHLWMKNLLSYQGPMVIFIDKKNKDRVQHLRKDFPTKIIERELPDLYTNKY